MRLRGPVSPRWSDCAEVLKSPEGAEFKALIDAAADKCPTLPCAPSPCESGSACSVVTVFGRTKEQCACVGCAAVPVY